ncbi:MAG: hypothetical protein MUP71_11640 [Candidatus Aminicenantes bacterium]|nr:hypothetical protein [Candidatus Aminicenantes bacterium]
MPRLVHSGKRFLKTGILPKGKLHIGRLVDGVINELIADLGGEQEITASQKIIISAIRQNLIFLALVNEWIAQQPSIIDIKGEMLSPLNGFYLACQNTVTRNCRELGLKRVSPVESLESYLAAKASAAAAVETANPLTKEAGAEKIIDLGASCEGVET